MSSETHIFVKKCYFCIPDRIISNVLFRLILLFNYSLISSHKDYLSFPNMNFAWQSLSIPISNVRSKTKIFHIYVQEYIIKFRQTKQWGDALVLHSYEVVNKSSKLKNSMVCFVFKIIKLEMKSVSYSQNCQIMIHNVNM